MKPLFLHSALWAGVVVLQGCALTPGYESVRNEKSTARTVLASARPQVPMGAKTLVSVDGKSRKSADGKPRKGGNAAPSAPASPAQEGVITPITPDLIDGLRNAQSEEALGPEIQALFGEPRTYRIGPGDVIGIHVYDHPELVFSSTPATTVADPTSVSPAPGFIVSSSGMLSFPYVGTFRAAGMTIQELHDTLTKRLARVFKDPQLSVRVEAFRSQRAYIEGEVRTPGVQIFTDLPMTLPEVINRAGGFLPTGDRAYVQLTRKGVTTTIDMMRMAELGVDPSGIPLQNGDVVFVRNRDESKVVVMGEVNIQAPILMRNGRLSLNEALSEAGGVNLGTSNPRQIYVIRNEPQGGYSIYHLDARTATAMAMADGFPLKPRDVVFVDPVPLATWSRVASLILPSTSAVSSVRDLPK